MKITQKRYWCDFSCPHARFADADALDGSKSCHTFIAIYCKKLKKFVAKNSLCIAGRKNGAK